MMNNIEIYTNEEGIACVSLKDYNDSLEELERLTELYNKYEEEHKTTYEVWRKDINLYNSIVDERDRLNNIINELEKMLEEEQDRLARETSNIYEDSLGKTRLVNENIYEEVQKIKDKLQGLKGDNKECDTYMKISTQKQKRIDKAIEYIEDGRLYDINDNCINEILLEILKGE